ncbi:MAG: glycosyltransferase [Alphaproteobacteria bacterium]|nr:glycosyltransferase [Alphaproteobacteria bacterium]
MAAIPPGSPAPPAAADRARIAVLCHGGGGGSTRAAIDLAAALARRGRDVRLVTLGRPRWTLPPGLRHIVVPSPHAAHRPFDGPWDDTAVASIAGIVAAICRSERIDLVHCHYGLPFAAVAAAVGDMLSPTRPAIVATLHGSDITAAAGDPRLARQLGRDLRRSDAVSTVSAAYAALLRATVDVAPPPVVVPNFAHAAAPVRQRRPGAAPVLIHVSSFRAVKDARGVARAFLAVRRRLRCRLLLVGDGPEWHATRKLLRHRSGDVRLLGFRDDVPSLLRDADILLLASRAESFSLAALEAMAAGVPVVAPRVGGLPEVIGDGLGGLLFHPGRSADAAARIVALLHAPVRYRRMAAAARRRAGDFPEARTLARYEALYCVAVARRMAPAHAAP